MAAMHAVIGPDSPKLDVAQVCVRATIIFVVGLVYIRAVGARTFGRGSPLDIVVAVMIGSNLSRAATGSAVFVPTVLGTAVLVALHWLFSKGAHRWHWLSGLVKGQPHDLVRDGVIAEKVLARYAISRGDLDEALRDKGLSGTAGVKRAVLERSGAITVIRAPDNPQPASSPKAD